MKKVVALSILIAVALAYAQATTVRKSPEPTSWYGDVCLSLEGCCPREGRLVGSFKECPEYTYTRGFPFKVTDENAEPLLFVNSVLLIVIIPGTTFLVLKEIKSKKAKKK